jgi:hypothetical protein
VAKGDLVTSLRTFATSAPRDATLVIFHSAVLAYVARTDRDRFIRAVADVGAVWISNEAPNVFPAIASKLKDAPPEDKFLLAIDGEPVAITSPHGQSMSWLN